ncbi:T9SS type A sorting domain-containing protein [bacterium BMS3Abin03]|nr:T9SS type A sorting domain-containing protein [bacterium BMS3Abin03]
MISDNSLAALMIDWFKKANTTLSTSKTICKSSRLSNLFSLVPVLVVILIGTATLHAGSKTWTGKVSNQWEDARNWKPSSLPQLGDKITISNVKSGLYPILSEGTYNVGSLNIKSEGVFTINDGTLNIYNEITIEEGGTLNHFGGILSTEDIELKHGGMYNETSNVLMVNDKFKNKGTYTSTGGTIHFIGSSNGKSDFSNGTTQFFNVIIDNGVNPMFDSQEDVNIKIAGSFTNNNPDLDVTKATFTFNGTGDQTIYSASAPLPDASTFNRLVIDKPSGTINLLSDIAVETLLEEVNGSLDLNGNVLWISGSPLPVELSTFSAINLQNGINLQWRTETEVNNYGFKVERKNSSTQNGQWQTLAFVQGHGNSNSPKNYSFIDEGITSGKYSYRLKQIDNDGKYEYSKPIEVDLGTVNTYELSQNYPNPFNPITTISFTISSTNTVKLSVFNSIGEKVEDLVNEMKEAGTYTVNFNAQNLPSGTYYYRIQTNDYTQTKKMILLK